MKSLDKEISEYIDSKHPQYSEITELLRQFLLLKFAGSFSTEEEIREFENFHSVANKVEIEEIYRYKPEMYSKLNNFINEFFTYYV